MSFITNDTAPDSFGTPGSDWKLEPNYKDPFERWQRNPDKHNTGLLLQAIQPDIDRGIAAHVGTNASPVIRSRAKLLALQAAKSYDPQKARLGTHVINNLQGLRRVARQERQVLRVPERVSLDQDRTRLAKQELQDRLGRDPTMAELADHTGLSLKRLNYIRKFQQPVSEGFLMSQASGENDEWMPAVARQGADPWVELVYSDMDPINQKILEWTLGLHGEPTLSNQEIARRLRISPSGISQRKAKIQSMLDAGEERSPF